MNDKACILLDIVDGKAAQVVQFLQGSPGVFIADAVEGPPDVIIVMEMPNREQLAKMTNQAIASVETMTELTNQAIASLETMTEHIHLIPARDRLNRIVTKVGPLR